MWKVSKRTMRGKAQKYWTPCAAPKKSPKKSPKKKSPKRSPRWSPHRTPRKRPHKRTNPPPMSASSYANVLYREIAKVRLSPAQQKVLAKLQAERAAATAYTEQFLQLVSQLMRDMRRAEDNQQQKHKQKKKKNQGKNRKQKQGTKDVGKLLACARFLAWTRRKKEISRGMFGRVYTVPFLKRHGIILKSLDPWQPDDPGCWVTAVPVVEEARMQYVGYLFGIAPRPLAIVQNCGRGHRTTHFLMHRAPRSMITMEAAKRRLARRGNSRRNIREQLMPMLVMFLDRLHRAGIMHADLHGGNILVNLAQSGIRVQGLCIIDMGGAFPIPHQYKTDTGLMRITMMMANDYVFVMKDFFKRLDEQDMDDMTDVMVALDCAVTKFPMWRVWLDYFITAERDVREFIDHKRRNWSAMHPFRFKRQGNVTLCEPDRPVSIKDIVRHRVTPPAVRTTQDVARYWRCTKRMLKAMPHGKRTVSYWAPRVAAHMKSSPRHGGGSR